MSFPDWLTEEFHRMAREYRMALSTAVATWREYDPEGKAVTVINEVLRSIPVPTLSPVPEEFKTDENRAYYSAALKPDFKQMVKDALAPCPE